MNRSVRIAAAMACLLAGCTAWVPGRQGYWDGQVKEMCEKDGGVTIHSQVPISRADIDRHVLPMTGDGKLGVALKELAHPNAPVYATRAVTPIQRGGVNVGRIEWTVFRRSDQAIVANWIVYARSGGDPLGPWEPSSFRCPDQAKIMSDLQNLFVVESERR